MGKKKEEEEGETSPGDAGFLYEPSHRPEQTDPVNPHLRTASREDKTEKSHRGHSGGMQPCEKNARGEEPFIPFWQASSRKALDSGNGAVGSGRTGERARED